MKTQEEAILLELKRDARVAKGCVRLTIVDEGGEPVAGARIGRFARWDDFRPSVGAQNGLIIFTRKGPVPRTGKRGTITLRPDQIIPVKLRKGRSAAPLVVIHEDRRIGAVSAVQPSAAGRSGTLMLQPLTRVRGKLTSTSLAKLGQKLHDGRAEAHIGRLWSLLSLSDRPRYELFLPPGKVTLRGGSENTYSGWKKLTIKPGQKTITADIDLPANRIARLIGKRAPEFKKVRAWNRSGPTTMKALRGKVVVLDFWSVWCGPCVGCMPQLMKLHDKYGARGLEIIAIHNDDVKTWKECDSHCRKFAKEYWNGRELPFRVAIDGGGRTHIPGFPKRFALYGHMVSNYGIWRFPTSILIDKKGNVVSTFDVRDGAKQVARQIEPLLRHR